MARSATRKTREPAQSSLGAAMRSPATHVFLPRRGYFDLGPLPPLQGHTHPADRANPPAGTRDRSWHALQPPGGHPPITFRWHAGVATWVRRDSRAKRLGFKTEYLSKAGWVYLRPANGLHD